MNILNKTFTFKELFATTQMQEGGQLAISPEQQKSFDDEDWSWWSDRYKEVNGVRPHGFSNEQLISWANQNFTLRGNELIRKS